MKVKIEHDEEGFVVSFEHDKDGPTYDPSTAPRRISARWDDRNSIMQAVYDAATMPLYVRKEYISREEQERHLRSTYAMGGQIEGKTEREG